MQMEKGPETQLHYNCEDYGNDPTFNAAQKVDEKNAMHRSSIPAIEGHTL